MKSEFRTAVLIWVWRGTIIGKGSKDEYFNADLAVFTAKNPIHHLLSTVPC